MDKADNRWVFFHIQQFYLTLIKRNNKSYSFGISTSVIITHHLLFNLCPSVWKGLVIMNTPLFELITFIYSVSQLKTLQKLIQISILLRFTTVNGNYQSNRINGTE